MTGIAKINDEQFIGEVQQLDNRGDVVVIIDKPKKVVVKPNGVIDEQDIKTIDGYNINKIRIFNPDYVIELEKIKKK